MKKFGRLALLGAVAVAGSAGYASAADIKIDTYGNLGAIWNLEHGNARYNNNKENTLAVVARAGADFYFENGFSFGVGAAGAWAAYDARKGAAVGITDVYTSNVYPNTGDVSDAYLKYNAQDWAIALGRYNANFLGFDWLAGNAQGVAFKYEDLGVKNLDLWVTYYNSVLITGYQPGRIASEMGTFYAYHPGARNTFMGQHGANIIAGGVNYRLGQHFIIDPFVLFNTSLAGTDDLLFQLGLKFGFLINLAKDWHSHTWVRAMFQYANQDMNLGKWNWMLGSYDDVGFLIWGDQEFGYQDWVKFGLGLYFVGGQGIWHTNNHARFYGNWVNAYSLNAFSADVFSAYLFGSFELIDKKLGIDLLAAFGDYTEYSAILKYTAWQSGNLKTDVGLGYVYNELNSTDGNTSNVVNYKGGHFLLFTKFTY